MTDLGRLRSPQTPGLVGAYFAVVTRVVGEGIYVTVPRLTGADAEWGPLPAAGGPYATGHEVIVMGSETAVDDLTIIGRLHATYYTQLELDALLGAKSAAAHTHDARYYTEAEVDALLAAATAPAQWVNYPAGVAVWSAGVTAPTIGNGTITARYRQDGKRVNFRITITVGSLTTLGSGVYVFALPVATGDPANITYGSAMVFDSSAGVNLSRLARFPFLGTSTTVTLVDINGTRMSDVSAPVLAVGDIISITGTYEAA